MPIRRLIQRAPGALTSRAVPFTSFDSVVLTAFKRASPGGMARGWANTDFSGFSSEATSSGSRRDQCMSLFAAIDTNNDGVLSLEEMVSHAATLEMTSDEAEVLFRKLDLDGDGKISKAEFAELDNVDLMSVKGISSFFENNLPFASNRAPSSSGPLGRWSVSLDTTREGGIAGKHYDHSA